LKKKDKTANMQDTKDGKKKEGVTFGER